MYDIIGDIHGHADKLEQLLLKLGYRKKEDTYIHPSRKALFIGDYIDRGPKIRETLSIVKSMVDNSNAVALMGNHEYNALCFNFKDSKLGGHLREHSIKNILQHYQTLKQFQNYQDEFDAYLEWFKTLPLFYETETFRAVHACWDTSSMEFLKDLLMDNKLNDELIYKSVNKNTALHDAIDIILKGKEIALPKNIFFKDKDGFIRKNIRIKWWVDPTNMTYNSISIESIPDLENEIINMTNISKNYYSSIEKKVFFGHYWLRGNPSIYRENICCLDYSVAKQGKLVAYRLTEDAELDNANFVYV